MKRTFNITELALILGIGILLTIQIKGCLSKTPVDRKIIENEIKVEMLEKELPAIREERDQIKTRYDSLLLAVQLKIDDLETRKQPIKNAVNKTDITVSNLDKEQFRNRLSNY